MTIVSCVVMSSIISRVRRVVILSGFELRVSDRVTIMTRGKADMVDEHHPIRVTIMTRGKADMVDEHHPIGLLS